ncbi:MAG: hypothetical protein JO314_09115, partial [Acidobacteria bacterium]|nr:hypothetical protein [Acidobacteriota bacterium]
MESVSGVPPGLDASNGPKKTNPHTSANAEFATSLLAPAVTSYTYSTSVSSTAWLTTANWNGNSGHYPGVSTTASGASGATDDVATFGSIAATPPIGINMNTTGGGLSLGAIDLAATTNKAVTINNSSTTAAGTLTLNGATLNSTANVILANESSSALTISNGSGSGTLAIALGNATENVIQTNGSGIGGITINSAITGAGMNLTVSGAGSNGLVLTGTNTYSGNTKILRNGAVVLTGAGSIANSPSIEIQGGGFFDVSALTTQLTLASGQGIIGSGTTSAGTITTGSGKGIIFASNSPLQFTAFNGTTAPLKIANGGNLTLSSTQPVTVNTTTALSAGAYTLLGKSTTGSVTGSAPTALTIGGSGICANCGATLA